MSRRFEAAWLYFFGKSKRRNHRMFVLTRPGQVAQGSGQGSSEPALAEVGNRRTVLYGQCLVPEPFWKI